MPIGSSSSPKERLPIKPTVMRELMLASGGRCAMTDCGLPLISPSGGWIGTVAHIVGAEKTAARGSGQMSREERRGFANLILMCATHGREVDAPDTGEANFPIDKLVLVKKAHEARVSDAVKIAVEEEAAGIRTADGIVDTGLRSARQAVTGEGLAESLGLDDDKLKADLIRALDEARFNLQGVSQTGIDALAQLVAVWELSCRVHGDQGFDFGDPSDRPKISVEKVDNRLNYGREQQFDAALRELQASGLLSVFQDADEFEFVHEYVVEDPWHFPGQTMGIGYELRFWPSVAWFLYSGHGVDPHEWLRTLDFTIFDRLAPVGRKVDWRD